MKSFKKYGSKLLKESIVTGVSPIVASRGWFRKFVKLLILCSGLAGFLIQTQEFLEIYWEYSTVALQEKLSYLKKPAITICDENLISRKYYCENNPKHCVTVAKSDIYRADPNDTYERDLDIYYFREMFSKEFFNISVTKACGFKIEKNLLQCEWFPKEQTSVLSSCGKPKFLRGLNYEKLPGACYTLKSSDFDEKLQTNSMLRMMVRWQMSDFINVESSIKRNSNRRYRIDFHPPGHVSNAFSEGVRILEGKSYKVKLTQVDTIRLPPPYSTKCYDYEEHWRRNQFTGPRGREDCQKTCDVKLNFEQFGCVPRAINYPHDKELCLEHMPYEADLKEKVRKCKEQCRYDCKETKYFIDSQIAVLLDMDESFEKYGALSVTTLEVFFDNQNSKTVVYRPKYESVELLSYIGSYLGMWSGWSIVALSDFVETLLYFFLHQFILRRKSKKKTRRIALT